MDRQHDGRGPRADMEALNAALAQLADSLMPTPGVRTFHAGGGGLHVSWRACLVWLGLALLSPTGVQSNPTRRLPACLPCLSLRRGARDAAGGL